MAYQLNNLKGIQDKMQQSLYPQYSSYQKSFIPEMKTGAQNLMANQYSMMTDPSKQGFSPEIQAQMYGQQADALSGARASFGKENNRQVAAQGLSNTGQAMRNQMAYDKDYATNQRSAARDVSLANAQQGKSDYWNAVQGYGNAVNTMGNVAQSSLAGTNAENAMWQGQGDIARSMGQIELQQKQLDNQGFWGSFKNALGGALGGGLVGQMFGQKKTTTTP